jgi:hypothetical protein
MTYDQALAHAKTLAPMQCESRIVELNQRAARGEIKIEPCVRCANTTYEVNDGDLLCDHCGLCYGSAPA